MIRVVPWKVCEAEASDGHDMTKYVGKRGRKRYIVCVKETYYLEMTFRIVYANASRKSNLGP
jgi:hypothetical protein